MIMEFKDFNDILADKGEKAGAEKLLEAFVQTRTDFQKYLGELQEVIPEHIRTIEALGDEDVLNQFRQRVQENVEKAERVINQCNISIPKLKEIIATSY